MMHEAWGEEWGSGREVMPAEYEPMASQYLTKNYQRESWHINSLRWDGKRLHGSARIEGYSPSATDRDRFHLSIFAARIMDAQFSIMGLHLAMGLPVKTSEVWQLSRVERCVAAITDPDDVRFEILIAPRRPVAGRLLATIETRVLDRFGGLFTFSSKVMMELPSGYTEAGHGHNE